MKPIAFAAIALVLAPQLFAQGIRIDSSRIPPPPPPVTATRIDSAPAGTMWSASVITAEELRRRGIVSLADALRLVPGAVVVQGGSPGSETSLFMRGGENDFVLFLLDGVRINEPGGAINLAFVPVDNIDRIEVVRGPAAALYGSGAVAGVVQIFTKKAGRERTSEIASAWGSRGTRNTELSMSVSGPASRYSLGAARYRTKGVFDLNNRTWSSSYSGSADFVAGRNTKLHLAGRYTDGHYKFPTNSAGVPVDSNSRSVERRLSAGAGLALQLSANVDAAVDASYMRQTSGTADPADELTTDPFDRRAENERRAAGARINFHGGERSVFTAGLEYELQHNELDGVQYAERDVDRRTKSAFAQMLARSEKNFELALGWRVDDSDRFGARSSWRVGMGTPVGKTTRVKGSIGTSFREPLYSELTGAGFANPNPALKPERTRSWEAGIEQTLAQSDVLMSVTYFRNTFFDMIATIPAVPPTPEFQNADRADAIGWELEMSAKLSEVLRISSGFTMLNAKFSGGGQSAGEYLSRRPSRYGNASFEWQPGDNITLTSDVAYVGRRIDVGVFPNYAGRVEHLGGYAKVDLSAEFVAPQSNPSDYPLMLTLRVDNALDRKYQTLAGFEAPGRRFIVGARLVVAY